MAPALRVRSEEFLDPSRCAPRHVFDVRSGRRQERETFAYLMANFVALALERKAT